MPQQDGQYESSAEHGLIGGSKALSTKPTPGNAFLLRRSVRAALVAGIIVMCGAVGYTVSASQPETFQAQAELLVTSTTDTSANARNLSTQVTLLTSRSVLETVAASADVSVANLEKSVSAEVVDDSQIVRLSVKDQHADTAVRLAGSILNEYLATAKARVQGQQGQVYLQNRINEVTAQLAQLDSQVPANDVTSARALLTSQLSTLQTQLTATQIANLQSEVPATVATAPYANSSPVSPQPLRAGVGGLTAGFILAAGFLLLTRGRQGSPEAEDAGVQ